MAQVPAARCFFPRQADGRLPLGAGLPAGARPRPCVGAKSAAAALAVASTALLRPAKLRGRRGRARLSLRVSQVFEFFSGIGGMRTAYMEAVGKDAMPQWRAMEVDEQACKIYSYLYDSGYRPGVRATKAWEYAPGNDEIWRCSLDKLPTAAFEGADVWLLNPPPAPFVRTSKKRSDINDPRCASFVNLVEALEELKVLPSAVYVESVPEFRTSKALSMLKKALPGYDFEEFVVNATSFGFPNMHRRFYFLASKKNEANKTGRLPPFPGKGAERIEPNPVAEYCDKDVGYGLYLDWELQQKILKKRWQLNVATATATSTMPFLPNYGQKPRGAPEGTLLLTEEGASSLPATVKGSKRFDILDQDIVSRLRYFAPSEILNLRGFPDWWGMPNTVDMKKQWRLICNSIHVGVAKHMIERLLAKL